MVVSPDPQNGKASLLMIEGGLTLIAATVAFGWPMLGSRLFARVEKACGVLARRRSLTVVLVGLGALLLRLAIIPVCPAPHPFLPDDFSNLLAADTFASGRLTNPTPPMWMHFESIHIDMQPTYMSMYFPGEGLLLAASKVLTGHPWYGLWLMSALMCGAVCWMLQGWLPCNWALLGGSLVTLRIGLFSYWINTYTGAGLITAFAGALVLGALARFRKCPRFRYSLLMAIGVVILGLTRPYEGVLLCLPVAVVVGRLLWRQLQLSPGRVLRLIAVPLALLLAGGAWMGYYNYRVFGSPSKLPYTVNRATYAMAPYFIWQSPRPEPAYRHAEIRHFYYQSELAYYDEGRRHLFRQMLMKAIGATLFFSGFALLPALLMFRRVLSDRRTRFLVQCTAIVSAGMAVQVFLIPHYLAPFTALFYAIGLQAMRHLRVARIGGQPVGLGLVRLLVTLCFLLGVVRLFVQPLHINMSKWPPSNWSYSWYGPLDFGKERADIESQLELLPGKQIVFVKYPSDHYPLDEWVYNMPQIDRAKVVWAREMDPAEDLALIQHYRDRHTWLVDLGDRPPAASPYPLREETVASISDSGH